MPLARRHPLAPVVVLATLLMAVLGGAAAGAPTASAASCPDADSRPADVGVDRSVAALRCLVAYERAAVGLPAQPSDVRVRRAAQGHADDMRARIYFSHLTPEGLTPGARITAAGFSWSAAAENIALGQPTPREAVKDWLASEGHCVNLLSPSYTVTGFGVSVTDRGVLWVQNFATPGNATPAAGPTVACPRTPASPAPSGDGVATIEPDVLVPTEDAPATDGEDLNLATAPASSSKDERARLRASARRSGRTLRVRVTLPTIARTRVSVRVSQSGRTVRGELRTTGRTGRLTVRLPRAGRGRAVVRAAALQTTVAFR
ncbi:CAP domain-containing protein [Patulibacter sp. SYSU D01012]|uniref:CAP domain-containing protein n=1 Tax=Patulibacter sp. SYSU D01012 TaxID=2817381 RepID=UPI001B30CCD5|nr:CAP domain-containing protein [Patulibacter sp. SYSU D01012]